MQLTNQVTMVSPDASLTESDLKSQTSAGGSSTENNDDLEIKIVTKMDDIDHDWI